MATATSVPSRVNVVDLLNKHLRVKYHDDGPREVAGNRTWRASKVARCLKATYLESHLKQAPILEPDDTSLRRFEVGHAWSAVFKQWFEEMGLLLQDEATFDDEELDIGAHGDFIIGKKDSWHCGIELKSVNSRWFWYRSRQQETTASPEHMLQSATYDILARRQGIEIPWMVLTVSKDDLTMAQDWVTETHRHEVMRRLSILNEAKETGVAPPCTCTNPLGEFGGSGWKYCDYWPGDPGLRREKKAIPDRECCVVTELEEPQWA